MAQKTRPLGMMQDPLYRLHIAMISAMTIYD
jgi:hypothetical protein